MLSLSASLRAQPIVPTPQLDPSRSASRADKGPSLMPLDTVWGLALNNAMTMPPAYEGTQGFFAIEHDRLVAYELIAGTQQWMVSARPVMPLAAGGGLVFLVESDSLKAVHGSDGSVAWELPFAEALAVPPVWDNGWLITAASSGEIRAYRAGDGELIWRRDVTSPAHAAPALAADRVYIPTTDGRIVALHVDNGEPIWERQLGGAVNDILALEDRLFAGSHDNFFYCVMAKDGRVDWRWRTGADVIGKPIADKRYVYFVALDNVLRAMNLVTGGQQWMRPLPIRPAFGAVKVGPAILVSGQTPTVHVFNLKDGITAGTFTGVATQPPAAPSAGATADSTPAPPAFASLAPDAYLAAAPYILEHPLTRTPLILVVFKEIARGASATLVAHSNEPVLVKSVSPLPNLVQIAPVTPTTPPPRP
jgi:outer membrane protein assembly factor BamB